MFDPFCFDRALGKQNTNKDDSHLCVKPISIQSVCGGGTVQQAASRGQSPS